ncbi:MAG: hypothetical protein AABY93_07160 [Bacteroidota bacterium]
MKKFEEIQLLRKVWWYWIIFIPFALFEIWGLINSVGASYDDQINSQLIILSSIPVVLAVFLFFARLKTEFNENEIVVKLNPVFITRTIPWNQISKVYIRKYELGEFKAIGSGAIPIGKRGIAYHLFSEYGLQIETTDGYKVLIGTRKPKSLQEFLKRLNKL